MSGTGEALGAGASAGQNVFLGVTNSARWDRFPES